MNVCSIEWLLGLLVLSGIFFLLPQVRVRQGILALCSLGFLVTQVPDAPSWAALAVFLGTGYGAAVILQKHPRRAIFVCYLIVLLAAFVFVKQYAFLKVLLPASLFERAVVVVGLSYMLFRQIHLVVDAMQGQIESLSLWNYLNYQLNLFGLLAGPIQRYQDFCQYWTQLTPILTDGYSILQAYLRVFVGVIKVAALASVCLAAYTRVADSYLWVRSEGKIVGEFLLILYLFPAYLYFNFSGYCDMVIGGASLLGMKMPENFNYPFVSRNMIDFWTRWHRTMGFWIRDYVFTPLFKGSASRWPRHATSLSFACFFTAFMLAGLWHGSTWNFAVFGLLNGLGVAAAKAWEFALVRRLGRPGLKAYLQSPRVRALAVFVCVNYVCFALLFVPANLRQTWAILGHAVGWR